MEKQKHRSGSERKLHVTFPSDSDMLSETKQSEETMIKMVSIVTIQFSTYVCTYVHS